MSDAPAGLAQHALLRRRWHQVQGMPQGEFLPSPCVSVCTMNPQSGLCRGCFRSLEEIADWAMQSPEGQRAIWQHVAQRMTAPTA
jgi:predicted Fe-S protein YdhL (DUF1289 family)